MDRAAADSRHDAATILVCDDDPNLRELVRAALGDGYRYVEAADGGEALTAVRNVSPDLLVLDLMLPVRSGLEVLQAIRADDDLRHVPVVVVTAWSHAEVDAESTGADLFVTKPFDPDELAAAVAELLG